MDIYKDSKDKSQDSDTKDSLTVEEYYHVDINEYYPPHSGSMPQPVSPSHVTPQASGQSSTDMRMMCDIMGDLAHSVKHTLERDSHRGYCTSSCQRGPKTDLPTFSGKYHESFEQFDQRLLSAFKHLSWDEGCSARWSCLPSTLAGDAEPVYYALSATEQEDFHLVMEAFRSEYGRHTKDMMQVYEVIE